MVWLSTATRRSDCAASVSHCLMGPEASGGSFPSVSTVSRMRKRWLRLRPLASSMAAEMINQFGR